MRQKRLDGLDIFRGLAICLMILYHFVYDLNHFAVIAVDMNHTPIFLGIRFSIMFMFLLSVGIGLAMVHQDKIQWKAVAKRLVQLGVASLLITFSTMMIFSNSWVYFGILHFILMASLLSLPLLGFPKLTLGVMFIIVIGSLTNMLNMDFLYDLLEAPLSLPPYTEDIVPLFPWLAVVLLGTLLVHYKLHQTFFGHPFFEKPSIIRNVLKKMGRHSLVIYLIHQPILFALFELYFY